MIIAHRTSPAYAPENSLAGIRVSFDQGADGVEIDLRMSLDLRAFLMHDNTMRRTTGWPLPIELTPAAIVRRQRLQGSSGIRADGHAGIGPAGGNRTIGQSDIDEADTARVSTPRAEPRGYAVETEAVPSLAQAIDALPAGKLFAVDVKTPWAILALVRAVKQREMQSRTLVWSSSEQVVRYAVRSLPGVEVAYYKDYEDGPNNVEFTGKAARIGAQAVSLDWRGINRDVVGAAHALGLKVYSWHKEHPITAEKIASGLDGVITDHPARARETIEGL